ncbi:MAG: FadR family transcriptional regulator [Synergistetes bacterium]|nr:FadR family transcriptional regulator [Synergistota bacterium]MCX8128404.1 FadR family transcriptional regulator [Synergistota bacterium]
MINNIQAGKFKVGDKIPPEQVIAEGIGVSRTAVREALVALEMAGVLERKAGDGTYVTGYLPISFSRALEILQEDENTIDIIEARKALEPGIAELVCERISEDEIKTLESFVNKMNEAGKIGDVDSFIEADYFFHSYLAKFTKNSILESTLEGFLFLMRKHLWRYIKEKCIKEKDRSWTESVDTHRVIVNALRTKNKEKAKEAMLKHFEEIFKLIEDR